MEEVSAAGAVVVSPLAERWRPVVAAETSAAAAGAPAGVEVEGKGLSVTLHWRQAPASEGWCRRFAVDAERRAGLVVQPGRMAVELRPPVALDKGTVVARLAPGHGAVAAFGDDVGDLPAFAALTVLGRSGVAVARVVVADPETPAEVRAAADVVVEGPGGAAEVLGLLAGPERP
jgi:trehalose 6-phosphate phosphatase